jgi:hypothetical protein
MVIINEPHLALNPAHMHDDTILIGLDDTDNLESRGTGHRARCMARGLEQAGIAGVTAVTRHQLLVNDAIPYTSHNSSACVSVRCSPGGDVEAIMDFCRRFLLEAAAEGSDAGLCAAPAGTAVRFREFGRAAQTRVLERRDAEELAQRERVPLEGLTGDHLGKIGAWAAIGLHSSGDDGRYLWLRGIRELEEEVVSVSDLRKMTGIELLRTLNGVVVSDPEQIISLGPWPRPVRDAGRATLLVEKYHGSDADWKVLDKDAIKAFRP